MRDLWMVKPGSKVDLAAFDPADTRALKGGHTAAVAALEHDHKALAELQTRLWAEGRQSVLLILQGTDASGKDGTIAHVFQGVNPQGTRVVSFKAPTDEELAHDFLWRVHRAVPRAGEIGIFNRSQYEDVLVARVRKLVPKKVWKPRYDDIVAFEVAAGAAWRRNHQVLPAHLQGRAAPALRGTARRPAETLEVPASATSPIVSCGASISERTRTRWSAPPRRRRPGTSSPPTSSGFATGRSAACSSRRSPR